jgi:hypothetical protein
MGLFLLTMGLRRALHAAQERFPTLCVLLVLLVTQAPIRLKLPWLAYLAPEEHSRSPLSLEAACALIAPPERTQPRPVRRHALIVQSVHSPPEALYLFHLFRVLIVFLGGSRT